MKCTEPLFAIHACSGYGPLFGAGHDLHICNNSNTSDRSHSNLGLSYNHPNYAYDSNQAKSFLAGSISFFTTEIEVYTKEKCF